MSALQLGLVGFMIVLASGPVSARDRFLLFRKPVSGSVCPAAPEPATVIESKLVEKKYTLDFQNTPWKDVLASFSKATGLIFLGTEVPSGTLSLNTDQTFTLVETVDLLNEILDQKNWVIIRREKSFLIHPADQKIPREILPQISLEDLKARGKSEIVQVVLTLKDNSAEEIAPQVKQLLSPFGEVSALGKNRLIIIDKAKNLRNIDGFLKDDNPGCSTLHYPCKYKRASIVADSISKLLMSDTSLTFNEEELERRLQKHKAEHSFLVNDETNTITYGGSKNAVRIVELLIKAIDQGEKLRPVGPRVWMTYEVPAGTAEASAKKMMSTPPFKGTSVRMLVIGNDKIIIDATPADHEEIAGRLKS